MKRKILVFNLILVVACLVFIGTKSYAAGSLNVSPASVTLNEGESATIIISGTGIAGNVGISSSSDAVSVSSGSGFIDDTTKTTVTVTAKKAGATAKITVSATDVSEMELDKNGNPVEFKGSKTINVTVKEKEQAKPVEEPKNNVVNTPNTNTNTSTNINTNTNTNTSATANTSTQQNNTEPKPPATTSTTNTTSTAKNTTENTNTQQEVTPTKSSNNYLEAIKLSGGTLSPEFNKRVTSYTVNVEKNTQRIKITATPEDSNATVKGDGEIELIEDETTARIQVVAENGNTNTYTIKVVKGAVTDTEHTGVGIQAIAVDSVDENGVYSKVTLNPEFATDVYEYKCDVPGNVKSLSVEAVANNENMKVEIFGNDDLKLGENVVTIMVKDEGTESTLTYQILVQKNEIEKQETKGITKNFREEILSLLTSKTLFIICIIVIILILAIFGVIIFKHSKSKGRRYSKDDEEVEQEETVENNEKELSEDKEE